MTDTWNKAAEAQEQSEIQRLVSEAACEKNVIHGFHLLHFYVILEREREQCLD